MMLTFLFLFALVVVAIVLVNVYQRGFNDGERFGAVMQEAKAWRDIARARAGVEEPGPPRVAEPGAEWELPEL
jgi:hypothetical protein